MENKKENYKICQDEEIEEIISSIVKDVHYEKTYPAHSAYYQLDFKAFRKRLEQALKNQQCNKCYGKGYRTELKGRRDIGNIEDGRTYSEYSGKQIGHFIEKEFCDCNVGKALQQQEEDFKKVLREIMKELEWTKFPNQVKRTKEFMNGYNYCKEEMPQEIISIIEKNNINI